VLDLAWFLLACSLHFSGTFRATVCVHTQYYIQLYFLFRQRTAVAVGLVGLYVTDQVYRKFIWGELCWGVLLYGVSIVCLRKISVYLRELSSIRSQFSFFKSRLILVELPSSSDVQHFKEKLNIEIIKDTTANIRSMECLFSSKLVYRLMYQYYFRHSVI
jgi:hypothetical protein